MEKIESKVKCFIVLFFCFIIITVPDLSLSWIKSTKGQTVYVPVYAHIYHGTRSMPFVLSCTLSIRNTDLKNTISILSVSYYDSQGSLLEKVISRTKILKPLESYRYIVKENDKLGGSGAKFIVKWQSHTLVPEPLIETIMIGTRSQQGISFTSRGHVIKEIR